LADFSKPGESAPGKEHLPDLLSPLRAHEEELAKQQAASLLGGQGLTGLLENVVPQVQSVNHWEQVAGRYVLAPLQRWVSETSEKHGDHPGWAAWLKRFFQLSQRTLEDVYAFGRR
jgi:hypothetical protein